MNILEHIIPSKYKLKGYDQIISINYFNIPLLNSNSLIYCLIENLSYLKSGSLI